MWSSMKITIVSHQVRCNSLKHFSDYIDFSFSIQLKVLKAKVSDHTFTNWWQYDNKNYVYYWWNGAFYIESLLDQLKFWKILAVLGFQIEVYLKVDRIQKGLYGFITLKDGIFFIWGADQFEDLFWHLKV